MAITEHRGRLVVSERSQGRCELCGAEGMGVHHRLKRSQGGTWSPANLLRLCGSGTTGCHGNVERHPALAQSLGLWLTRANDDPPELEPVLCRPTMWWLAWWLPAEDGTWTYQRDADPAELTALAQLAA